ncbi:mitochondrial assembly of ribosomal large subunit protein 1 isoform X1 [Girardinichthys multiradiatus]|uniref:mitochondrial assembly of ribosomal large subunit protein 1 isoform X1 n=1 Tax=Girardinichthys multiradiatus TaxID=208333 RepID=UPI001FAC6D47|nr:mitochondrial assembly of ribosomal large subunit protein 1 isoform X1 [Girardinichthys multiradiatus]
MSFMCRFRILISSVCRKSSLLDDSAMSRCLSMFSKARCHRLPVELSSCQQHWRQGASPRCLFESKRRYTDRGESRLTERTEKFEEQTDEMEDNRRTINSQNQGFSETFNLDVLVSLLRQENAVDLCVIKVPDHIQYAEYFIVVSGVSPRHLRAMALYAIKVYKFLRKDGELHVKIEGKGADDWMCVDFGNMVVHLMLPETREVYELEKLWTLRAYDEQLRKIPSEMLPEDFVFDAELTK